MKIIFFGTFSRVKRGSSIDDSNQERVQLIIKSHLIMFSLILPLFLDAINCLCINQSVSPEDGTSYCNSIDRNILDEVLKNNGSNSFYKTDNSKEKWPRLFELKQYWVWV